MNNDNKKDDVPSFLKSINGNWSIPSTSSTKPTVSNVMDKQSTSVTQLFAPTSNTSNPIETSGRSDIETTGVLSKDGGMMGKTAFEGVSIGEDNAKEGNRVEVGQNRPKEMEDDKMNEEGNVEGARSGEGLDKGKQKENENHEMKESGNMGDDEIDESEELERPCVFQCKGCRTLVGDSFSYAVSSEELRIVCLNSAFNVNILDQQPSVAKDGFDVGSTYLVFSCAQCSSRLGKIYKTSNREMDNFRELYSFSADCITSYELGSHASKNAFESKIPSFDSIVKQISSLKELVLKHNQLFQEEEKNRNQLVENTEILNENINILHEEHVSFFSRLSNVEKTLSLAKRSDTDERSKIKKKRKIHSSTNHASSSNFTQRRR